MDSLYNISQDILNLFNTIEENDGEITDEQYDSLCIKQNELKSKLESYVKAIKTWEADEQALKAEKKRFNDRQNVFKNRIERLKKAALDAVLMFGEKAKTNYVIELPMFRLSSRSSKSIVVNEDRIKIFVSLFERYIRELVNADILYSGKDVDLQGILNAINANAKAEEGEDFEPFTLNDLINIKLNISQTASIYDLFKSGLALNLYGKEPIYTKIENATTKEDWSTAIECSELGDTSKSTMASISINQSLQIR